MGDEDQSIYGWRGARAGNLKRFTEDFPGTKIVRLEENYRSTQTILDAAAAVVKNNSDRVGKNLQATAGAGAPLKFYEAPDSTAWRGGLHLRRNFLDRTQRSGCAPRRFVPHRRAIRAPFEEVLRRMGIRYRVVGGFSFYERAEVRNALAYIRLLSASRR